MWSVRVDEKLLAEAKPILKAKFGSTCRAIEVYLSALVATEKGCRINGVNPSSTIEIGKLVIERNLRSRRKLVIEEEVVETVKVRGCGFCHEAATGVLLYKPKTALIPLCEEHYRLLVRSPNYERTDLEVSQVE